MRTIAFVVFPRFQLLDAAGPIAAFEIANRYAPGAYQLRLVAARGGAVASSAGVAMIAERFPARLRVHTLLVAGGEGTRVIEPALARFVRTTAKRAHRIASVCSGAYVLASLGLLDGKRATTHWQTGEAFARRFPKVAFETDRIFVCDGRVWTSAGITAGIDLALAMIAEDLGETVARQTAQQLVVYYRRPGGQSQFSALLELDGGPFSTLLGWAREHLDEDLSVARLAARVAMSPRTFARRFAAETNATPARAIERLRVELARQHVESGPDSIDEIATWCGFGDPERMRRAFVRMFGQPPQALRRAARAAQNSYEDPTETRPAVHRRKQESVATQADSVRRVRQSWALEARRVSSRLRY